MHSAQGSRAGGQRVIDLDEPGLQSRCGELLLTKKPREKPSVVTALLQFDQISAAKGRRDELHTAALPGRSCRHRSDGNRSPSEISRSNVFKRINEEFRKSRSANCIFSKPRFKRPTLSARVLSG